MKKNRLLLKFFSCFLAVTFFSSSGFCASKKIEIKSTKDGSYKFYVNGKHFLIKGVGYNPTPIGAGYDYDLFTDPAQPWLVDGKLMKKAKINTIRIYSPSKNLEKMKEFIQVMHKKFGVYTIVSDWVGLWDFPRANYADKNFQKRTKERILKMVRALKNEEGLLMWILGNENNYTFSGKIGFWTSPEIEKIASPRQKQVRRAEIYYSFINEIAREIKKIDKIHPVALGNGKDDYLNVASKFCDEIDILAIIVYRGKKFGNLFNNIRNSFDKPIMLSEFGCDSYDAYENKENQKAQSEFILSQWQDLYKSTAFSKNKSSNVLGGCLFEWSDEWWKHNEGYTDDWVVHNTEAGWSNGAYFYDVRAKNNLNMNEEWFGIVSLSEEKDGKINKRIPKKAYYDLRKFFINPRSYKAQRRNR